MHSQTFGIRKAISWAAKKYLSILQSRFLNARALWGKRRALGKLLSWRFWLSQSVGYGESPRTLDGEVVTNLQDEIPLHQVQ